MQTTDVYAETAIGTESELPSVPIHEFLQRLKKELPKLIELVTGDTLRHHELWGKAIPYQVPSYGSGRSKGHCVRPDILLTRDGPKICELDFVPSGRGYLLASLGHRQQEEFTKAFERWYRSMGATNVLYTTASTTTCRNETEYFANRMRRFTDIRVNPVNIDRVPDEWGKELFVDRLSYRSEMNTREEDKLLANLDVSTAEPYLDSKAIFAMIHEPSLTKMLEEELGVETLEFFRQAFPHTMLVSRIKSPKEVERIAKEREKWTVKNSDVETDVSWGSRGTTVGARTSEKKFTGLLLGTAANAKPAGTYPILQRWHASRDFWYVWNAVIDGVYEPTRLYAPDKQSDTKTTRYAEKEVGARLGFYFLVNREARSCEVAPYGCMVMRQDDLIHGASDALCVAVQAR
ncbi:MAG: hypothetical protein ABA06_01850 [Parcubacteria bacterium C7867-001]|nr:MAG: hypothetical protein ABA06_01850 [Parcubacteria bacterium C7867-001]